MRSPKDKLARKVKKISVRKKKIIVNLRINGMSINEIKRHFQLCHNIKISNSLIREIILKCFKRARKLNGIFDSLVSHVVDIIEIDEIYQGMEGKYLGVTHKQSMYLMKLEYLNQKSIKNIKACLTSIAQKYDNIMLVLTDGLPAYKSVIPEVFDGIPHQLCHVHMQRDVMKMQDPYNNAAKKAYSKYKSAADNLKKLQQRRRKKKKRFYYIQKRLNSLVNERNTYYSAHGIIPYSKKMTWDSTMLSYKEKIGVVRANFRSLKSTIATIENRIVKAKSEIAKSEVKYKEKLGARLRIGKIKQRFFNLLNAEPGHFKALLCKFKMFLKNSSETFCKKLYKFIKNNPHAFSDKNLNDEISIAPNQANTNMIESIFSKYRLFFDKYRRLANSELEKAVFEILRLCHNLSKPYTGFRKDTSPLQRLGIRTRYDNYLDALFAVEST